MLAVEISAVLRNITDAALVRTSYVYFRTNTDNGRLYCQRGYECQVRFDGESNYIIVRVYERSGCRRLRRFRSERELDDTMLAPVTLCEELEESVFAILLAEHGDRGRIQFRQAIVCRRFVPSDDAALPAKRGR